VRGVRTRRSALAIATALAAITSVLTACGDTARLPIEKTMGSNPTLPEPRRSLIPTVALTPAVGWPAGAAPRAADDLLVVAFARGLDHPRWLFVLPNGDVLVAESQAPVRPEDEKGLLGYLSRRAMKTVGAAGPSADRITLLRGVDAQGAALTRSIFLTGLHSPIGMALVGNDFYVANTDAILKFSYQSGALSLSDAGVKVADLPGGPLNHHWTKNLLASSDGSRLYVAVGSNSNVAENGMAAEFERACIWELDLATGKHRVFASGLRNPVGMAWQPLSGALWTVVNERDELGSDVPPDYLTSVRQGGFYGWPYSYFGHHVDARVTPARPDLTARAIVPDYALGPHTASLGLTFASGTLLPERYRDGAFIGQHGSWNRKPLSGYQVLFVPFANGQPSGAPLTVLRGFVNVDGEANGRPVGVAMDSQGALLVADDVGGVVWRVTAR
jgi:glucose/arabinose dehydrogenase